MIVENWKKIFATFQQDKDITALYEISKDIMTKAEIMMIYAIDRLRHRNTISESIDIYEKDKEINAAEIDIRRRIFIYLTVNQPNKKYNVAMIMSLISHDMERIGDYSKNISDLSDRYKDSLEFGKFNNPIKVIENLVLNEFSAVNSHFMGSSERIHKSIGEGLTECNNNIEALLKEVHDNADETGLPNEQIITLIMYLRFLKRISSHLRNITSSYTNPIDRIGFKIE